MPDSITNLFRTVDSVHSYQTRAAESGNLCIPKSLHSSAQKSISNKGAKIWNEIPYEIRDSGTIQSLKKTEGALHENAMQRLIYHISAYTDASSGCNYTTDLPSFIYCFLLFQYLLADLSAAKHRTVHNLSLRVCVLHGVGWGGWVCFKL